MDQSEYTLYSLQRFQTRSYVFNLVSVSFIRRISDYHNMLLIQYHKIILFFKRSTTSVAPTRETTRQDMLGSNANLNPLKRPDVSRDGKQPFRSRLGDSFRRDAYLRRVVAAASVTWPIPRFLPSSSSLPRCGGPKARQVVPFLPFPTGFALPLLYHSITMHAAETLVSSPLGSEVMQGAPAAGCSHGLRHAITHQRSGWNTAVAAVAARRIR